MSDEAVVIVAGGSGTRMGTEVPKQFLPLGGKPILLSTVERVREALPGAAVVVVLPEAHMEMWRTVCPEGTICVAGGESRFHSVKRGLEAVPAGCGVIAVHDGVRPLASTGLIRRLMDTARREGAAVPVTDMVDSLREVSASGESRIVDRSRFRAVQTPQAFRSEVLRRAYDVEFDARFTDDASVAEAAGTRITLCEGERSNIKITTPDDLVTAEALLTRQKQ